MDFSKFPPPYVIKDSSTLIWKSHKVFKNNFYEPNLIECHKIIKDKLIYELNTTNLL